MEVLLGKTMGDGHLSQGQILDLATDTAGFHGANRRWLSLMTALNKASPTQLPGGNMLEWLEITLRNPATRIAPMLTFLTHTRTTWREWCKYQFEGKKELKPAKYILEECTTLVKKLAAVKTSTQKLKWLDEALSYLQAAKDQLEQSERREQFDDRRLRRNSLSEVDTIQVGQSLQED
ncbi:hypothetical protein R1sor_021221 [Riccia sorocarpa]|uniref:Uncharacterized protein n=1 Tax=Riccia sorocarpa TaxID=122646 RepID=A0ABD3GJS7_9MARC